MLSKTVFAALVALGQALPGAMPAPPPPPAPPAASSPAVGSKFQPASTFSSDVLAGLALLNKGIYSLQNGFSDNQQCTPANVAVRREWSALSLPERRSYIDALLCLQSKPSHQDPLFAPGVKTRWDDFVAVHINQTFTIHATASFLSWHRYFTWTLETALRNECGYKGYQPYWNWAKYAYDPINSPLFDGSDYSMSGNGEFAPHNATDALGTGKYMIPPGQGGGCVKTGPFKNYTVNLGPVFPSLQLTAEPPLLPLNDTFGYNPRCLRRDINPWVSSNFSTDFQVSDLITNYKNITQFQNRMQGQFDIGFYGVHSGGHYTIGGDPGGDFFVSPAEPAFYLHHAQIDRTWWIWQNQDPKNRINQYEGPTFVSDPTSPPGKITDIINMGNLGPSLPAQQVMDTTRGPLCYIYV